MDAIRSGLRRAAAFALLAGVSACGLVQAAQAAGPGSGAKVVPTVWDCTNGDTVNVNLPPVAISPGQGALTAPFPGFVTGVTGPVAMPLGTYVVLAVGSSSTGPWTQFGHKNGLAANAVTCGLEPLSLDVWVIIAPAGG